MAMVAKRMSLKEVEISPDYDVWIRSIKERVQRVRFKALMMANAEQNLLYWDVGHEILEKQDAEGWGSKIVERMSKDLTSAFPDMKGWSPRNLKYMRAFAAAWGMYDIVQAPLAQLPTPEQLLSKLQTVLAVPSKAVKGGVR